MNRREFIAALAVTVTASALAGGDLSNRVERLKTLLESPRLTGYERAKYAAALPIAKTAERALDFGIRQIERLNQGPFEPCAADPKWWMARHERKLGEIAALKGKTVDIVFLGDSISHNWEGHPGTGGPGEKVLDRIREKYTVLDLGFGGDRTYHAIWRARHGELDGYRARFVSLLIGCNNWTDNTPEETADEIRTLVGLVREKQPQAKVLLMPLLPRNEQWYPAKELDPENLFKAKKNEDVNKLIASIPDGEHVLWFDLRQEFRGAPLSLMTDRLHPNHDGYVLWWNRLRPYLEKDVAAGEYREIPVVGEPFGMPPLREFVYPDRRFAISDFGAKPDGSKCTEAIAKAIAACNAAGGGYVVVPKGTWLTGKVHLRSNVNLRLEEGATLEFSDEKADYLPAVLTTWEGVECWNTSPLVYAYGCENVAITGPGALKARTEGWYARAEPKKGTPEREARDLVMKDAWLTQYMWGSTNAALSARRLPDVCPKAELRPQFIQLNRCRNVLLAGFRIRRSPFWCVHLYRDENVIVRGLDVRALQHNNDAFDIDMTRNVLIEDCTLENGDDGFCMKAGRNQDAWRLRTPTENVVVRNCRVKFAHTLLGIGSELSGGIRNVSLHDCTADETYLVFFAKTNPRRGGFVKNVFMDRVEAGKTFRVAAINTDVFYQYADFPTFEVRPTEFDGIRIENLRCAEAHQAVDVRGDRTKKVRNLVLKDVKVDRIRQRVKIGTWDYALEDGEAFRDIDIRNAEGVSLENVKCGP